MVRRKERYNKIKAFTGAHAAPVFKGLFMKRIISIILSAVLLLCAVTSTCIVNAENSVKTAITVYADKTNNCSFGAGDSTMWYKFTAPSTNWYKFEVYNPYLSKSDSQYHTYISVHNSTGTEIEFTGTNEFTDICACYVPLEKSKLYYIELDNFVDDCCNESYTVQLGISVHKHTIKREVYPSEVTDYSFISGDCLESCTVCDYEAYVSIPAVKTINLSAKSYVYDGKVHKPGVSINTTKGKALAKSNYTVAYPKDVKSVGNHVVKVKFKNDYSGSRRLSYKIVPKGTSLGKLTGVKSGIKATWKKQTVQTSGYQIQCSTSAKFTKAKTVTVAKNKTTATTVKSLISGKKYYVRVRTYKTVNGKKICSAWSKAKQISTK